MPHIVYFFLALSLLVLGYIVYGKIVEKIFRIDARRVTPALSMADGVDYVPLSTPKVFLIHFLNIAGIGPVFGPILGALYGPKALLWIVLGSIFAGGVHDYLFAMITTRYCGRSLPEVVEIIFGKVFKVLVCVFTLLLLVLVGVVFVNTPAALLAKMTEGSLMNVKVWILVIFLYYVCATVLPINKFISWIYPLFGLLVLVMALGVMGGMLSGDYNFYQWRVGEEADFLSVFFSDQHPRNLPAWPLMCVTIACGAVSGFHATQSPLMARCITNEKAGRPVFYGAMIAEGAIALIWATAGMTLYESPVALAAVGNPGLVVDQVCRMLLGPMGGLFAVAGVVMLPITSGDTAFRAARLIIADAFKVPQKFIESRLAISIPLFIVGGILTQVDFHVLWRYFAWSNQTLAMLTLWVSAAYIARSSRLHWIATLPATYMTAVVTSYLCVAPEGFQMAYPFAVIMGCVAAALALVFFLFKLPAFRRDIPLEIVVSSQQNQDELL
ncbi:MAG: carbon starvation protein A [Desulfovibrio sp.]|jgi:carbon starvation protein CstA|nr:carbon starvation protein A [Desulfovibrio sp.]